MVPIRHHSPACAAHLERLIAEVGPAAILVEGPSDFDPLIESICDRQTRAPVAIVSLRDAEEEQAVRRIVSYFPFCAHSPELIALQAAYRLGIIARFIDLPSTAREMEPETNNGEGRSLLGSERGFDVGDYVSALARTLGCRDGNEVWDQLFETRLADGDWRSFFEDVARYCTCIRGATDAVQTEQDGTLVREAHMRAIIADARKSVTGPIVAVMGGFHAEAMIEPSKAKMVSAKAGMGRAYLIRYGMRQLDALSGYGAGLPLPGFYDRLWQMRGDGGAALGTELITGFAAHLRKSKGEAPSFPVVANAIEQAERLAALRGRPFPMRDDVIDAVRSSFIKEEVPFEQVPLLNELRGWLTGTAIGEVPPSAGSPPLIEAARNMAKTFGFSVADGERRRRELDIYRKPKHRAASRFCHAMALIGSPFAERTAGPDFRNDISLDRLHEVWTICWSPLVESRLIELSEVADNLSEALAFVLANKITALSEQGKGRNALAAIDLFAAACRAGLGKEADAILTLVEAQVIEDPEPASLVSALTDLLLLRRGREALGIEDTGTIDSLIKTVWRRLLLLLPEMADLGADQINQAVQTLADLRGAIELARSSQAPIDLELFDQALERLSAKPIPPMLEGALMAFALLGGQAVPGKLEERLSGEMASGYADPAEKLAYLGGVIAIAREIIWTIPSIIDSIDSIVSGLAEEEFVTMLPYLRLALMPLDPREVDRLAEEVSTRLGVQAEQLSTRIMISESELNENLRLDKALSDVVSQDCLQ